MDLELKMNRVKDDSETPTEKLKWYLSPNKNVKVTMLEREKVNYECSCNQRFM